MFMLHSINSALRSLSRQTHEEPCPESSASIEGESQPQGSRPSAEEAPSIIYGTAWKGEHTDRCVTQAVTAGFRAFDTAAQPAHYREDLIQTKYTPPASQDPENMPYSPDMTITEQVRASVLSSLHNLRVGTPDEAAYLDAVLLHTPFPSREHTLEAWRALEEFVPHRVPSLGVSNISYGQLEHLGQRARIKPGIVQNRLRAKTGYDKELRQLCALNGCQYQAYGVLGSNRDLIACRPVLEFAAEVGVDAAVSLFFLLQQTLGVCILAGTAQTERMGGSIGGLARVESWLRDKKNAHAWDALSGGFISELQGYM
ncbi:Uu.00g017130.m01.CDS01 [Anthostomella pinea]|uniref:Uu.00g017130.m01.CDS01 n=1 Tax=Anthostomella pinea TaxID=933095 RepID=A0AAI8YQG3_9PEZI|nr:Uu.00g017130.m01.CDS01 [Anthostomella pinea]